MVCRVPEKLLQRSRSDFLRLHQHLLFIKPHGLSFKLGSYPTFISYIPAFGEAIFIPRAELPGIQQPFFINAHASGTSIISHRILILTPNYRKDVKTLGALACPSTARAC